MGNPAVRLNPEKPIVVVDDEPDALRGVALHLRVAGFTNIRAFASAGEASDLWKQDRCAVVVLDVIMPDRNGLDVLKEIKADAPHIPVIMVTGVNEIETAVNCLRNGAYDYLLKPIECERLVANVTNVLRMAELERDYTQLAECMLADGLRDPGAFADICTRSESVLRLFRYVESVGPTGHPVLVTGETGVGKELFARAIHRASGRSGKCVSVNVAGLDDAMFSDTLFGHVKGAFTGADGTRGGLVESAAGGTLFLDEIGDLSVQSQVKLLRLVQEREFRPLGSDSVRPCEARVVAATCRDLNDLSASPQFRKDLYYRLRTHHIHVPPLRERREDIQPLASFFIEKAAKELGVRKPDIPPDTFPLLNAYHYPGNVRELEAMVFDTVSNSRGGRLSLDSIHKIVGGGQKTGLPEPGVIFHAQLPTLKEVEHLLIREAFHRASGNQTEAAGLLGITRQTLAYRLKRIETHSKKVSRFQLHPEFPLSLDTIRPDGVE